MQTRRLWIRALMPALVLLLVFGVGAKKDEVPAKTTPPAPLLTWSILRSTFYDPIGGIVWPDSLLAFNGKLVRLEGYIMSNFAAQDPGDLLLTAIHPRTLFCGPSDMTAIVEVYFDGFDPKEWPALPIEITGVLFLSKNPNDLFSLYRLLGYEWRPLRRWKQDFPGVVDEVLDPADVGPE